MNIPHIYYIQPLYKWKVVKNYMARINDILRQNLSKFLYSSYHPIYEQMLRSQYGSLFDEMINRIEFCHIKQMNESYKKNQKRINDYFEDIDSLRPYTRKPTELEVLLKKDGLI